ncbi:MAG: glutamate synthase subunit alpha, partial [Ruminococcus sp.]|nr:glutamate synthase subunit alpha [Ruminococcus sp.]
NSDKMLAREENMASQYLMGDMDKVLPVINPDGSDSARLDNTLEFLVMSGMELPLAVMITIPEPWDNNDAISQKERDFYQYYATMMEPWDGPASILFSDGDMMGAVLDRNGLRPSRYYITDDDHLILSSEVGALPIPAERIVKKERLHPGKMLLVDTVQGRLIGDEEIKLHYASKAPYGEWLDSNLTRLKYLKVPNAKVEEHHREERRRLQKAFGYTYEDVMTSILPMAQNGSEPIAAMGSDKPLAVLSDQPQPLFDYFKQNFAQVTNPPIDAIREEIVTSTTIYIGKDGNLLEEKADNCKVIKVVNPILTSTGLLKLKRMNLPGFKVAEIPILYYKNTKLSKAIRRLYVEADKASAAGANILILSDRGVDENHLAIPSLLAVSALHQHLVATKRRTALSIVLESGEPREVHHFATLLAYGASAVNPYLALETIHELIHDDLLDKDYYAAIEDYNNAVLHGIVKIASKMGISTLQSYQGSKNFEALGLSEKLIDEYFTGTVSRIGGITLEDIEQNVDRLHSAAFDPLGLTVNEELESRGSHKSRSGKEEHLYNPQTIHALQAATRNNDYKQFKEYSRMLNEEMQPVSIRGLFDFNFAETPLPIDEVE